MSILARGCFPSRGTWDVVGINSRGMSPGQELARGPPKGMNVPARPCQHLPSNVTLWRGDGGGGSAVAAGSGSRGTWGQNAAQGPLSGTTPCPRTATFPHQDRAVPAPLEPFRGGDSGPWSPALRTGPSILPERGGKADPARC